MLLDTFILLEVTPPHTISFTVEQFLWVCGIIITLGGVGAIIVKVIKFMRAPELKQNERITKVENHLEETDKRLDKYEEYLVRDKERLDAIEEGNKVVQRGILAIMNHEIDGNDIEKLTSSRDKLQEYLVDK